MIEAKIDTAVMKFIVSQLDGASSSTATTSTTIVDESVRIIPSVHGLTRRAEENTQDLNTSEAARAWDAIRTEQPYITGEGVIVAHASYSGRPQMSNTQPHIVQYHSTLEGVNDAHDSVPVLSHVLLNTTTALRLDQDEPGFVVQGEISVFGVSTLKGTFEKWIGPPPDGENIGHLVPIIEKVTLVEDLHISLIIPELEGTVFDSITFKNVVFFRQNYAFDKTKAVGWHVTADFVIDKTCGVLYDILTELLHVRDPTINLHAGLGLYQHWSEPLSLHSFTLEGVLPGFKLTLFDHLHFASLGVRLSGIRGFKRFPRPHSTLSFGFGVFGTVFLDIPSSVVPLHLDYEIGVVGKTVQLTASVVGNVWEEPLGIEGLRVRSRNSPVLMILGADI